MTQGTDRDTPFEGADRDGADVPERSDADLALDAPDAGADTPREVAGSDGDRDDVQDVVDVPDRGDEAPADEVSADGTSDDDAAPADAPSAGDDAAAVGPTDEVSADRSADEVSTPDRSADDVSTPDRAAPQVDDTGAGTRPAAVAAARPLAPPASESLAAWPSWDDVAVTAPASSGSDDAARPDADTGGTSEVDEPTAAPAGAGPMQEQTAEAPGDRTADATEDESTEDESTEDESTGVLAAPPLSFGGLSALAFTALNAASVGVPAHGLPQSSVTGPSGPAPAQEPQAEESTPDGPTSDDPTPGTSTPGTPDPGTSTPETPDPGTSTPGIPDPGTSTPGTPPAESSDAEQRSDVDAPTQAMPVVAAAQPWPTTAQGAGAGRPAAGGPVEPQPDAERESSPLDVFEPEDGRRRWPRTLAIVGGAIALVGALYVGASYALADRVPRGATVAGVQVGAMSTGEAEQVLADELAERTTTPVPVVAQDVQAELDPTEAGLRFDPEATVARMAGVDLTEPVRLWRHLAGVREQPPVTHVDDDALDASLGQLSGSLALAPVDGTVLFADGAAHATEAVDGWALDTEAAAEVLVDGWLTQERPVELPTAVVAPAVTQEETQRALIEIAQPLAAAPVTVQVADRQAVLDVPTLTAHAALVPVDGRLELQLDGQALTDAVLAQVPDLLTVAADARFEFQDGAPVIVPGVPGTTLDPPTLATAVGQAATAGAERVATVELVQSDPAQTTQALEALGVKEIVSDQSTPLTSEPRRTANIAAGLANITGTLVRPGETFSLTEALGPIDAAHGFVQAGAIVNGEHTDAWGGGLSQVSTTTYNAAYFAGYEDVEHTPHSEWFSRYPEGREATIFTGVIDLKWKNNTPYGALVQGFVADGRAHVRIWSTKHFTVESEKSGRSGVVAPTTVYSQSPTCERQSKGNPGFTVTNTRRVFLNGELVDTESNTWRYKPQNEVICGTAPAPGAAPTP